MLGAPLRGEGGNSIILKKCEAWDSVTHQYNVVAASGFRTSQQLLHLYENLKQTKDVKHVKIKALVAGG